MKNQLLLTLVVGLALSCALSLAEVEMMATTSAGRALPLPQSMLRAQGPLVHKRSLCNTFGGCGAKRSFSGGLNDDYDETRLPFSLGSPGATQLQNQFITRTGLYDGLLVDEIISEVIRLLRKEQS